AADVVAEHLCRTLVDVRVDRASVERQLEPAVRTADRPERALDPLDVARYRGFAPNDERRPEPRTVARAVDAEVVLPGPVVKRLLLRRRQDRPEPVVDVTHCGTLR